MAIVVAASSAFAARALAEEGVVSGLLSRPVRGVPSLETDQPLVSIRLSRPPDRAKLDQLERAGAELTPLGFQDAYAISGRILSARVHRSELARVARVAGVERIEPAIPILRLTPLDQTTRTIGTDWVWSPPPMAVPVTGRGIVVADHEFGWDITHPDFFLPDGGGFDFIDMNRDGIANGTDRIRLPTPCPQGQCEWPLVVLQGERDDFYTGENAFAESGYQPSVDWMYVDLNRDGRRNAGRSEGFGDESPALGEPIFAGDDINQNNRLDAGERLFMLRTPKVRAVYDRGQLYERGRNLSSYGGAGDAFHGTGATGILAGGWPELRRYTGVAPGVDLVLVASEDPIASLAASEMLGAQVNMYEWDSLIEAHDGSSNFEVALAEAAQRGTVQLTAVGNLAGSQHCMKIEPVTSTVTAVRFTTDAPVSPTAFYVSLTWRGALDDLRLAIVSQSNERLSLDGAVTQGTIGGVLFEVMKQRTSRGTSQVLLLGFSASGSSIGAQVFTIEARARRSGRTIPQLRGLLADDASGWQRGVAWVDHVTDEGTGLMPSTADRVISVGAFGGNHDLTMFGLGSINERRTYSGLGPRIDGERLVDIAGPDDPFSPRAGSPPGYSAFGGTSGALPHVTGAAALALGTGFAGTHDDIMQLLQTWAITDRLTGATPNENVGYGRLHVGRALLGEDRPPGSPPMLSLSAPARIVFGSRYEISVTATDRDTPADQLRLYWDVDYDREYDQGPITPGSKFIGGSQLGRETIVGKAVDPSGRYTRAFVTVEVVENCTITGCPAGSCCSPDGLCAPCGWRDAGVRDAAPRPPDASMPPPPPRDAGPIGGDATTAMPSLLLEEAEKVGCGCGVTTQGDPLAAVMLAAFLWMIRRFRAGAADRG